MTPRSMLAMTGALLAAASAGLGMAAPPAETTAKPRTERPGQHGATARPLGSAPVIVALDPGHGGTNLGAAGPVQGVYEKRLMLALAERIRALVEAAAALPAGAPRIEVVLCRQSDALVPIRARARCAKESGAILFLSLHANAVPAGVTAGAQRGFEVFVLGPREVEDDASLAVLGHARNADAVWAAHEVRAAGERSILLARFVADHMTQALGADAARGIKQSGAALDVLRGTGTAAALVEVGFIDHPQEGVRLASVEGREPIARALAAAIRAYVLSQAPLDGSPWRTAASSAGGGPAASRLLAR